MFSQPKKSHFVLRDPNRIKDRAGAPTTFNTLQLARLYNFPQADGTGETVGIIQLGGGYTQSDLVAYMRGLGLADNTVTSFPNVVSVSVDGATNNPNDPSGASVEVILDTEIILSLVRNSPLDGLIPKC